MRLYQQSRWNISKFWMPMTQLGRLEHYSFRESGKKSDDLYRKERGKYFIGKFSTFYRCLTNTYNNYKTYRIDCRPKWMIALEGCIILMYLRILQQKIRLTVWLILLRYHYYSVQIWDYQGLSRRSPRILWNGHGQTRSGMWSPCNWNW